MTRGKTGMGNGGVKPRGKGKVCSQCGKPFVGSEPIVLDHYSYDQNRMGADWTWRHKRCPDAPAGSVCDENV
jgi:hypothetical protein